MHLAGRGPRGCARALPALLPAGCITFPEHSRSGWPPPAQTSVPWINFATTLDESLARAGDQRIVAAPAGAAGVPPAYLADHGAGAVRIELRPESMLAMACLRAIAFPALAAIAKSLRGRNAGIPSRVPEGRTPRAS